MDSNYISQDAYRNLASTNYYLTREYNIANERKNLTQTMIKSIPIRFIDMNAESNITNPHTGNNSLGIGGQ